jgi:hypothetical protein
LSLGRFEPWTILSLGRFELGPFCNGPFWAWAVSWWAVLYVHSQIIPPLYSCYLPSIAYFYSAHTVLYMYLSSPFQLSTFCSSFYSIVLYPQCSTFIPAFVSSYLYSISFFSFTENSLLYMHLSSLFQLFLLFLASTLCRVHLMLLSYLAIYLPFQASTLQKTSCSTYIPPLLFYLLAPASTQQYSYFLSYCILFFYYFTLKSTSRALPSLFKFLCDMFYLPPSFPFALQ